jgi:hypothetical protein
VVPYQESPATKSALREIVENSEVGLPQGSELSRWRRHILFHTSEVSILVGADLPSEIDLILAVQAIRLYSGWWDDDAFHT